MFYVLHEGPMVLVRSNHMQNTISHLDVFLVVDISIELVDFRFSTFVSTSLRLGLKGRACCSEDGLMKVNTCQSKLKVVLC